MMSTIFWKALKVSPAIVGASLFVASSAYAAGQVSEQTVTATSQSAVELNSSVETSVAPEVTSSETLANNSSVEQAIVATDTVKSSVDSLNISQIKPTVELADNSLTGQVPAVSNTPAGANAQLLDQLQNYTSEGNGNALDQVTNVGQLRDVSPGDWAYEALRNLVERYGCIAGYPDGTFRGNRAMTRYEFAAGLNACLNQLERIIGGGTPAPDNGDTASIRRLVQEFQAELQTLTGRVDTLEGRVSFLEDHQFSATTKLKGEVIFALADAWGDEKAVPGTASPTEDLEVNTIFADRVRLRLETSFTGKDLLTTRLNARNLTQFGSGTGASNITGTNMTRLSFDGDESNNVKVDKLWYRFPLSDKLTVQIDATGAEMYSSVIDSVNPFFSSDGSGSISRFGRFNPIYRVGQDVGAAATYKFSNALSFSAGYFADDGEDVTADNGLFNGTYSALAQLTFKPTSAITLGLTYAHSYYSGAGVFVTGGTGSGYANRPFNNVATATDSFGLQANAKFGMFSVGGWVGYQDAEAKATTIEGSNAEIWNWMVNFALPDLGGKGNLLGFQFGMPPKVTDNDIATREDSDTSFHIEALYRYKLTDNIAITPGVIVILNPEHNDNNDSIWVGTLRTTFTF
ncbi:iron uptake porin [Limnofasciculus baicalensis]|uniref:Iron uptake porin n=1 Tax=Limnofasciculus baicalensis BBK-W-15 TaxID=2699891 RepID=A0AAE3GX25_9CYAN|nr:iron uptake porin [Limnofasciculus baicalensis]MCP2732190.1 iron uptake porin [Limnofasciculus baicalensis BBK-W-15]